MSVNKNLLQSALDKLLRDAGGTTPSNAPNVKDLPQYDRWGDPLFRKCPICDDVYPCFIVDPKGELVGVGFPRGCYQHDAELWAEEAADLASITVDDDSPPP